MFFDYFIKGNGLERLINDPTDENVKALETLGEVVFPQGDISDFLKGAFYYQAKKYDMALVVLMKLYRKSPIPLVAQLINEIIPKTEGK
jgi:hypothetical protein